MLLVRLPASHFVAGHSHQAAKSHSPMGALLILLLARLPTSRSFRCGSQPSGSQITLSNGSLTYTVTGHAASQSFVSFLVPATRQPNHTLQWEPYLYCYWPGCQPVVRFAAGPSHQTAKSCSQMGALIILLLVRLPTSRSFRCWSQPSGSQIMLSNGRLTRDVTGHAASQSFVSLPVPAAISDGFLATRGTRNLRQRDTMPDQPSCFTGHQFNWGTHSTPVRTCGQEFRGSPTSVKVCSRLTSPP